jgi:tRNA U34 2-thiouridine synthase MnmA/TrmU
MNKKAIALFSGGLDSILAAKIIMDEGIDIFGVTFMMEFASRDIGLHKKNIAQAALQIGLRNEFIDISEEFLEILKNPRYGFGSNTNPCIDCKILMLKKAKTLMENQDASFVITGEVLGERPMSQRKDALNLIENKSGLKGYLLRPLSAKLLNETVPEENGIIDRNRLFGISGRSRKPQLELAKKYGIKTYFTPAGGCLLTDPCFSKRLKDILNADGINLENIRLLKYGRHFRLGERTKFVLGRDEEDNKNILLQKIEGDIVLEPAGYPGPIGILRGEIKDEFIRMGAELIVTYSKKRGGRSAVRCWQGPAKKEIIQAETLQGDKVEAVRI